MNEAGNAALKSADEMWALLMVCAENEEQHNKNRPHPAEVIKQGLALQKIADLTREEAAISMLVVMTMAWNGTLNGYRS